MSFPRTDHDFATPYVNDRAAGSEARTATGRRTHATQVEDTASMKDNLHDDQSGTRWNAATGQPLPSRIDGGLFSLRRWLRIAQ